MEDPMPVQVEAPEGGCGLWEAHAGASSWQDLWPCGERSPRQSTRGHMLEQSGPEGLHPMEETVLEKFMKDCLP
ncbi:EH domain-containing protein 4 [Grus japonensis]|uniref:EH domain-containing protein 4 n=1 Tax=Grus japonensis TaxID=30415 RepID=A0ABC9W7N0_GRUJA